MATSLLSTDPVFVALERRVSALDGGGVATVSNAEEPDTKVQELIGKLEGGLTVITDMANRITGLDMRVQALENEVPDIPTAEGSTGTIVTTESEFRNALLVGGIIHPRGEFRIGSYLHITAPTRILGYLDETYGPSRIIVDQAGPNTHAFFIDADDVELGFLDISGAQAFPTASTGTSATHGNHTGIHFARYSGAAQKGNRLHVHNCRIHNLYYGINSAGGPTSGFIDGITLRDNWFHTFSHTAVQMHHNLRNLEVSSNLMEWRRAGETHIYHPDSGDPNTAGNCMHFFGALPGARILGNRCIGAYGRWGIELFYIDDSFCIGNTVENCAAGISIAGNRLVCLGNDISGSYAPPNCNVASIEVVGYHHLIKDNVIWDGLDGVTVPWGIVVQGSTKDIAISGNNISKVGVPIQINALGPPPRDLFIHDNDITINDKAGELKCGINANGTAGSKPSRIFIEGNKLIGSADPALGVIILEHALKCYVKRNTHISPVATGDDTIFLSGVSEVYTDDANTLQTANPVTMGTNTRVDEAA